MKGIVAPGYSLKASPPAGLVRSAEMLPSHRSRLPAEPEGTLLEFAQAGEAHELAVPIPRLAGLDELEVDRVDFDLATAEHLADTSVAGSPSDGAVTLALGGPAAAAAELRCIEIEELRLAASPSLDLALQGSEGGLSRVLYRWNAGGGKTDVIPNGAGAPARQVHLLVRPATGGGFGPPIAAAPHFAMPGAGRALYGPALGSATLQLTDEGAGKIKAVLRLDPPVPASRVSLLLGHANQSGAQDGLPNEVVPVTWSAAHVKAVFGLRPTGIGVTATAAAAGPEQPVVAEFPADPGTRPVPVDFSGVARSLLKKAYPASSGPDLGLKLRFTAATPGSLRVDLGSAAARYLSRPLAHGPATLKLLGAPETLALAVSSRFKPTALSFTLDGTFGPARLTLDSDTAAPDPRHGFRVAAAVRIARRVALTAPEANLPVVRCGLYGRASETTELLLSLHRGDAVRLGAPLAEPLSLEVAPSPQPAWQRAKLAAPGLLPPHPGTLWLIVRATRGAFWWHGAQGGTGSTQRSADDGGTFTEVGGRPALHLSVREVGPPPPALPVPVFPVSLAWRQGLLNADVVGVAGMEASLPAEFRRFWIAQGIAHKAFLDSIPAAGGLLQLTFDCQRDLELTVSDAVLTYDPWSS